MSRAIERARGRVYAGINRVATGCWEWRLARTRGGYGKCKLGREQLAHRVSWIVHNGPIPPGQCVLHRCDNRSCVRPDHLFLGSLAENNADRDRKGRFTKQLGEGHPNSKLTSAAVVAIREQRRRGVSVAELAIVFGVKKPAVYAVLSGRTWSHVA